MFTLPSSQRATSFPSGWQPFLAPRTARRPTRFSPSATPWAFPTSRPSGNIRCPTTGTRTTSACTPTSPPSAEPSWTWCTSSSGERSRWCTTTAQVQVQWLSVFFPFGMHVYSLHPSKCDGRVRAYGWTREAGAARSAASTFVTCQVNSKINGQLFCPSPAGAAPVSLPDEWAAAQENKSKFTQRHPAPLFCGCSSKWYDNSHWQ